MCVEGVVDSGASPTSPPKQYLRFVCVEPGSVAERVVLPAGETWLGGQVLEVQRHR